MPVTDATFQMLALTLKAVDGDNPNGEFEAVLSTPDVDRDGETIAPGAFEPLPKSIPIHFDHDFVDKVPPVGRGVPFYDGDVLKVAGTFASTPRAQELRALVNEGMVDSMSAGFLIARGGRKGKTITKAELIEGSLTATPVNRSALLVRSKALAALKAGARNSTMDMSRLQQIHDLAVANGADCPGATKSLKSMGEMPPVPGSYEERQDALREALQALYPPAADGTMMTPWVCLVATTDTDVVWRVDMADGTEETYRAAYTFTAGEATVGTPEAVDVTATVTVEPADSQQSDAPPAAAPAAKAVAAPPDGPSDSDAEDLTLRLTAYDALATAASA